MPSYRFAVPSSLQCLPPTDSAAEPELLFAQTVSPSVATESAKALPQQKVEKEKVWLLFLSGAAALFGGTVLLENNEALFPAIARSNRALAASRKDSEVSLLLR